MKKYWQCFRTWLNRANPSPETLLAIGRAWRWTAAGLMLLATVYLARLSSGIYSWLGAAAIMGLIVVACLGVWLALLLLARLPSGMRAGLLLLAAPLIPLALFAPQMFAAFYLLLAFSIALIATGVIRYRKKQKVSAGLLLTAGVLPLMAGLIVFFVTGWSVETPPRWPTVKAERLDLPNPAEPGPHVVLQFSYGSGFDRHRDVFAAAADWTSDSVDASKLIEGWEGLVGWARTGFWGFDPSALPLQGRVWMPDGEGPFPLVLIVHGNHEGADFSDVGYGYLAELFASQGNIAVSVDENFLNSYMGDFLGGPDGGLEEESDARAWLLLEHLSQWRKWSTDSEHPMFAKADLDRVVLIGHSRGGEAVSEAALFNRLPRYPDDGTLEFDFGFGIQGIIAIAPVDHQYHPRDRPTLLEDTNLLVIHGSHDSDVDAFVGSAMYSRLEFRDCIDCFKSSFYLVGANHGQFNTSWGRYDSVFLTRKMLNVAPLLDPTDQRTTAQVMLSAFLRVTLHDDNAYLPFLARPELGAHWFPQSVSYLSNYLDARMIRLVDFEEDADLLTAGEEVERIEGYDLSIWKEAEVPLRWLDMDSAAVLLGWGGEEAATPLFEVQLLAGGLAVAPQMTLSFTAAMAVEAPEGVEKFEVPESLDFKIELIDGTGSVATVMLSDRRLLYPQVDPVLYKLEALSDASASEPTFQRFVFPFHEWQANNPALDLASIQIIRFRFPADEPASIWLDDLLISPDGH